MDLALCNKVPCCIARMFITKTFLGITLTVHPAVPERLNLTLVPYLSLAASSLRVSPDFNSWRCWPKPAKRLRSVPTERIEWRSDKQSVVTLRFRPCIARLPPPPPAPQPPLIRPLDY